MDYLDVTDIVAGAHSVLDKLEAKVTGSWLHRWFWHSVNVTTWTPPVHFARSWELDYPFRKSHTVLIRWSFRRSVAIGFWGKTGYDEDTALLEATIHGRSRRQDERDAWDATVPRTTASGEEANSGLLAGGSGLRVLATTDDGLDVR